MGLIVQKYGGTSVANAERIKAVAERVKRWRDEGHQVVVVVSAMSGETDRLVGLAKQLQERPLPRELDVLLSTGEQVTIALLSMALDAMGCAARSYTGGQVHILTDSVHNKARIHDIDAARVGADLDAGRVVVIAGFQGVDAEGNITTLGRGGSDTSAVAIAAALKADECQIYTDVDGVYTTDPRVEPKARKLDRITFEEMLEMASLGSKVLQIRSVEFAGKYKVPLRVLSSFQEGEGTLITFEEDIVEDAKISGIAFSRDEAKLTVLGVPDQPGVAYRILGPIADANIEVDMIIQNVAAQEATTDFTFTVHRNDFPRALEILDSTAKELGARQVLGDSRIVKISLVGVGMRSHAGIASLMFSTLAKEGINIRMISTSEIKISVVVDEKYLELGVRSLHDAFGLGVHASS
ncbi:MAG: aspartate kinase [Gammaproteobacteria bacterium]|nr:aspartate kinase [Gammaproteobacteria bacterium]